jgi:hypothetical protein
MMEIELKIFFKSNFMLSNKIYDSYINIFCVYMKCYFQFKNPKLSEHMYILFTIKSQVPHFLSSYLVTLIGEPPGILTPLTGDLLS